ncbi:MAG: FecR/PupR family sigma factor regulator, partial [Verrucomicrobia bacterium]|nr:FecR/PupR family sigma factor regulator [Verrucomicrobiota bacterium]
MSSNGTTRDNFPPADGEIYAVALRWVQRRAAGLASPEREQFRAWLAADPRHCAAFAQADPNADEFDWPLLAGTTDEVLDGLELRARRRRRRRLAAVSGATAAMLVAGAFWFSPRSVPVPASESPLGDSRA